MARLLIIDDERSVRDAIQLLLEHHGHDVQTAVDGAAGIAAFDQSPFDLLIVDQNMPGLNGLETLAAIRGKDAGALAIFLTAFATIETAVEAMKTGAFDFLQKPFDNNRLLLAVERALEVRRLTRRVDELQEDVRAVASFPSIVGQSAAIRSVKRALAKVAGVDTTVLLLGESGTGKDLAAMALHRHSRRSARPFVAVNCAAIPSTLAESELFGHERGAFTDAKDARPGRFEQAHTGTIFLDEIGELSADTQARLLRVLQDRTLTRLGGRQPTSVDVRVVAATNRDLAADVASGKFRSDLFWRLNVFPIAMPALRDRIDDVPLLAEHLLDRLSTRMSLPTPRLSSAALDWLRRQSWPGNIRELENRLERALVLIDGEQIDVSHLADVSSPRPGAATDDPLDESITLDAAVAAASDRLERTLIERALVRSRGNRTRAAKALGISRRTLFTKMLKLGLASGSDDDE